MSGKLFLLSFGTICWLAVAIMNIADHAAGWKIVATGAAAVVCAMQAFKVWRETRA